MDASASTTELPLEGAFDQFTIGFDRRDRERVLAIWDSILRGQQWSEGEWVDRFEEAWSGWSRLPSIHRFSLYSRLIFSSDTGTKRFSAPHM